MEIIIIAAMAQNRVIGCNNQIPWHLPSELKFFKQTTMGHALIMGRKTFTSIGHPLPGRLNIVLSRKPDIHFEGCRSAQNLEEAIALCVDHEKVFIIGGEEIYKLALPATDTILLTVLEKEVIGDTFFPPIPSELFTLHRVTPNQEGQPYSLHHYTRLQKR